MGCVVSMGSIPDKEAAKRNADIEKSIKQERIQNRRGVKLLLLGAGESGKSTVVKQMRIIHMEGYSTDDYIRYRSLVQGNVVTSMVVILKAMKQLEIEFDNPDREYDKDLVMETELATDDYSQGIPLKVMEACRDLWTDNGVQRCFCRASEYQLWDCAKFFLTDLNRIGTDDYLPNDLDVLRNRMYESIRLFEAICNNNYFNKTPIILFLNKTDLFREKLEHSNITTAFPNYEGKQEYEEASNYIRDEFKMVNRNSQREIYVHKTCATDTANIQFVFDAVSDVIIALNLTKSGLVD